MSVFPYWAISIDMLVPRGQLKAMYSASHPAFWYVLSVPASNAINRIKKQWSMFSHLFKQLYIASSSFLLLLVLLYKLFNWDIKLFALKVVEEHLS